VFTCLIVCLIVVIAVLAVTVLWRTVEWWRSDRVNDGEC
jgi:hypothetical protein